MRTACIRCSRISGCSCAPPVRWGDRGTGKARTTQATFRRQVLARDGACVMCGSTLDLRAAHIIPKHQGGSDDPSNGRALCRVHDMMLDPYAR